MSNMESPTVTPGTIHKIINWSPDSNDNKVIKTGSMLPHFTARAVNLFTGVCKMCVILYKINRCLVRWSYVHTCINDKWTMFSFYFRNRRGFNISFQYIFFHLTFQCYCFCSSNVPTLYSLLKLVNKSINIWPFSYWPCYMPLILIMASDDCNGPWRCIGPLQPSSAIFNTSGM